MNIFEKIRNMTDDELGEFARELSENKNALYAAVAELTLCDDRQAYSRIAEILSYAPVDGTGESDNLSDRYLDIYLHAVRSRRIPERDYIKVLLAAQYEKDGSALNAWDGGVDKYIEDRAAEDFDGIADLIDEFDPKYGKYGVLIKVDRRRAVVRLLNKVLFVKNINKTAVRDVLMDRPELADELFELYKQGKAKERAAITRLLLLYKNEPSVSEFLAATVAVDKSKTVRDLVVGAKKRTGKNPAAFFERLMATGEAITFGELKSLVSAKAEKRKSGKSFAEVADRILFCYIDGDGEVRVFVYNESKFIGADGNKLALRADAPVYVAHPLDLPPEMKSGSPNIDQPFLQLARPVYEPLAGETYKSDRLTGTMVARSIFDARFSALKYVFAQDREGSKNTAVRILGDYAVAVDCEFGEDGGAVCGDITFYRSSELVKLGRNIYIATARQLSVRELPLKSYSELMYGCYMLFGCN